MVCVSAAGRTFGARTALSGVPPRASPSAAAAALLHFSKNRENNKPTIVVDKTYQLM
jgi:hypothetical protein